VSEAIDYNSARAKAGDLPASTLQWLDTLGGVERYQRAVLLDPDGKCGPNTQRSAERKIAEGWAPDVMLDLSHWQREPDWNAVAASGVGGVYLKATQGATGRDRTFAPRHAIARRAGLRVGAYHFATGASVDKQVAHFVEQLRGVECGGLVPVLDLESYPKGRDANEFAHEFVELMSDAGHECALYTYLSFWSQRLAHDALPLVPLWIARYNGALYDGAAGERMQRELGAQIKAWQTTYKGGEWPGVPGRVDVNLLTTEGLDPFIAEATA